MDNVIDTIIGWFVELEEHIPGSGNMARDLIIGRVPEADKESIYTLARHYADAANELADLYEEVSHVADALMENWASQGAVQWTEQWLNYLRAVGATMEGLSSLSQSLDGFGFQIELQEFMVALNLIMLGALLLQLIIAAFFSGGASLSGVVPAFLTTGRLIGIATTKTITAIGQMTLRVALRSLTPFLARVAPTLVRTATPALTRTALPALTRASLPVLARSTLPALRTAGSTFVRTTLPNFARNLGAGIMRGLLPRNVIARHVADRMANQWLRSTLTNGLIRNTLGRSVAGGIGRSVGSRAATMAAGRATRAAYARALEQQLARQFGARVGGRAMEGALGRLGVDAAGQQAARSVLMQQAAAQTVKVSFRTEVAKYLGTRIAMGGLFMGGGNLIGQLHIIDKRGLDPGLLDLDQVKVYAAQGALFGAGMWGSPLGHAIGGGVAGGLFNAATGESIRDGVLHGAFVGGVFGAASHFTANPAHMPIKIGQSVHIVPAERGPGFITRFDTPQGGHVPARIANLNGVEQWHAPGRGAAFFRTEGGTIPEGGQLREYGVIDPNGKLQVHRQFLDPIVVSDQPQIATGPSFGAGSPPPRAARAVVALPAARTSLPGRPSAARRSTEVSCAARTPSSTVARRAAPRSRPTTPGWCAAPRRCGRPTAAHSSAARKTWWTAARPAPARPSDRGSPSDPAKRSAPARASGRANPSGRASPSGQVKTAVLPRRSNPASPHGQARPQSPARPPDPARQRGRGERQARGERQGR
ncbi:hypothetical protein GCM10027610_091010 [Dactylosporangium cerinum]